MQKIMFDDKRYLTQAVLQGRKTMTRRFATTEEIKDFKTGYLTELNEAGTFVLCDGWRIVAKSRYKVGEEVAVAQSYKTLLESEYMPKDIESKVCELVRSGHIGCTNKMYVAADLMPKRIRITAIKAERLQDITDEDCMREGVQRFRFRDEIVYVGNAMKIPESWENWIAEGAMPIFNDFLTPREAFAAMINWISGKGTWESNPYVFAYSFELV